MTLPDAILFPHALLPLYIFEPRYRKMLADSLASHRMFAVARQRPDAFGETPETMAGVGLIRVCVGHPDGTSHLVLQGVSRVHIEESIRREPYPLVRIYPVESAGLGSDAEDALVAKVRELVGELIKGNSTGLQGIEGVHASPTAQLRELTGADLACHLDSLEDAGQLADLVANTFLEDSDERQTLLEANEIGRRLRRLIQFLLAQVRHRRKSSGHE